MESMACVSFVGLVYYGRVLGLCPERLPLSHAGLIDVQEWAPLAYRGSVAWANATTRGRPRKRIVPILFPLFLLTHIYQCTLPVVV